MSSIFYNIFIHPIFLLIEFIFVFTEKLFKTTGFSIVFVSIVINSICIPLYLFAEKFQNMERIKQKSMASKIKQIKSIFKGDEQYLILSTFYRQNKYHPIFALRSLFGILFQIPFFIAAYIFFSNFDLLNETSFLLIKNLAKPDALLKIFGGINILPIVMTVINIFSSSIYVHNLNLKDKIQLYSVSILFFVLLYDSSSALVIYWTINNIFSLLKNIYLNITFKNKKYLIYFMISAVTFFISWYTYFILQDNLKTRILISSISLIIGLFPWSISSLSKILIKIKHTFLSQNDLFSVLITSILLLWLISGLFIPSILISSSPQEFSYINNVNNPLFFIFFTFLQSFGLFLLWPLIIFLLFSKNIKYWLSVLLVILAYSSLINVLFFSGNYGPISSDLVFTEGSVDHGLIESLPNIIIIIFLSLFIILVFFRGYTKFITLLNSFIIISILVFSGINIQIINNEYKKLTSYYLTEYKTATELSPIFNLSKNGQNVIVIMLDMAESVFLPFIFEENNYLKSKYDGFVYYPNTVSFNGWTTGGAPPIFGGYEYTPFGMNKRPNLTHNDKTNESLLLLPRLFSNSGFSITITDPPYADSNWIPDLRIYGNEKNLKSYITDGAYTDLWLNKNNLILPKQSKVLERNILWYSFFRQSPLLFRKEIYFSGSWCATFSTHLMRLFINGYSVLDFLSDLTDYESSDQDSLILFTNNTTHEPLFLQAPDYRPAVNITNYGKSIFNKETRYHINSSALISFSKYLDFLKSNDLYDNSRIIIVSDHGCLHATFVTRTNLPFHVDQFNPLLLVKDFNARGEIITDMRFMTNADVPLLAMKDIIENPSNPFTGESIELDYKKEPQLILIDRVRLKDKGEIIINQKNSYYVHEDIFKVNNWIRPDSLQ